MLQWKYKRVSTKDIESTLNKLTNSGWNVKKIDFQSHVEIPDPSRMGNKFEDQYHIVACKEVDKIEDNPTYEKTSWIDTDYVPEYEGAPESDKDD